MSMLQPPQFLQLLEYVDLYSQDSSSTCGPSSEMDVGGTSVLNVAQNNDKGMQELLVLVRQSQSIHPTRSELEAYLEEDPFIPSLSSPFCALEWWKSTSGKYKVLSKMSADILAVPISSVASESTFSAGGRVIDEYRSRLNTESIEALICGGDWLRNKYGLKRKQKELFEETEILLKP